MLDARIETLADGRRLRVARVGAGPPLVLLHGYPENLQIWCELAPRLAGRFEVIAFDWPGMGYSDAWTGGATPGHQAERLATLLDHWGLPRVTLAGMDMGGQPALEFAIRHPQRVERLVVMNSLVMPDERTSWEIRLLRRYGWNRWILRHWPRAVFRRAERSFLPRGMGLPDELRGDLWNAFRRVDVRRFIAKLCAGYQGTLPALAARYGQVRCPTLVLWGASDRHFPPAHATGLLARLPDARLQVLAAAEHWMAWHRADDVATAIRAFADATSRGG